MEHFLFQTVRSKLQPIHRILIVLDERVIFFFFIKFHLISFCSYRRTKLRSYCYREKMLQHELSRSAKIRKIYELRNILLCNSVMTELIRCLIVYIE